jgi:hypothetical protein
MKESTITRKGPTTKALIAIDFIDLMKSFFHAS